MSNRRLRLVGVWIGIVAMTGLVGPYIVRAIYNLVFPPMSVGFKVALSIIFVLVNMIALKWGNKVWKTCAGIFGVFTVSMFIYETIVGWMNALTGMLWLKFFTIGLLVVATVISIVSYRRDFGKRKRREED